VRRVQPPPRSPACGPRQAPRHQSGQWIGAAHQGIDLDEFKSTGECTIARVRPSGGFRPLPSHKRSLVRRRRGCLLAVHVGVRAGDNGLGNRVRLPNDYRMGTMVEDLQPCARHHVSGRAVGTAYRAGRAKKPAGRPGLTLPDRERRTVFGACRSRPWPPTPRAGDAAGATDGRHPYADGDGQGVVQPVLLRQQNSAEKQTEPGRPRIASQSAFDAHSGPPLLQ